MEDQPLKIAVVGTGVAGLTAAYLLQRRHQVTLFEKSPQVGGHTQTIVIPSGPEKWTPIDAGFTYLNDLNYPLFHRLLEKLQIPTRPSRLSFAFWDEKSGFHYALTGLNGVFAQRSNLWNASFFGMLREKSRFKNRAAKDLFAGALEGATLGDYLIDRNFSKTFIEDYLLPLGASLWTLSVREMRDFPAAAFIHRLELNGLLGGGHKVQWQTVAEGSHSYVRALIKAIAGRIRVKEGIEELVRKGEQVLLRTQGGKEEPFDKVVLACHADEALSLFPEPTEDESRLLSPWRYQKNFATLHTDTDMMPPHRRAWACWNYIRERESTASEPLPLTCHMNAIQGLDNKDQYFVTFNRVRPIPEKYVLKEMYFTNPIFTREALSTQAELPKLNGVGNTYYCGSYFGLGSHEDAVKSAVAVAQCFGMDL